MKRIVLLIKYFSLIALPLFVFSVAYSEDTEEVFLLEEAYIYEITIDGEIKAGTVEYVRRAIREAEDAEANLLLVRLETPGGLVQSTREMVDIIIDSPLPVAVYVYRPGGWAYSAGTFILLAADYAFVHPEASIGAAEPRVGPSYEGQIVDSKALEAMASWIKGLADIHGRDSLTAERFVRENLTINGIEAVQASVADGSPRDMSELVLLLGINEFSVQQIEKTALEVVFDSISHPYIVSLFLTVGSLALIFAFRTGEFELSGVIGVALLLVGMWGTGVISFNFMGLGLIALGLGLIMFELFYEAGFGFIGSLGVLLLLAGIFVFDGEPLLSPGLLDSVTLMVASVIIGLWLFMAIVARKVIKTTLKKPVSGPESLVGLHVLAVKDLNPAGSVRLQGQLWSARIDEADSAKKGEQLEIVSVKGNTLFVKKISE